MKLLELIEWCVARRTLLLRASLVVLGLLVAADAMPFLVDKEHAHTRPEHLPGFWAVFGFLGCVVIIVASKAFGHAGIMTREDYYDE